MSEIKEGEYIRTTQGYIAKVEDIGENIIMCDSDIYSDYEIAPVLVGEQMKLITKHSFNIIDLIQLGDYVNGDEIIIVYSYDENGNDKDGLGICLVDDDYAYYKFLEEIDIKNIVTKEQFNRVMYKVEE